MRLLLAEDNPADVGMIRMIIEDLRPGLTVYVATNGVEVLEKLGKGNEPQLSPALPVDLVLLDVNMPKMTGLEVLKALQGSHPPPIVVLTSSFEVCRVQALQLGAVDCQVKPLDLEAYEAILAEIVDRWLPPSIS